MGVEKREIVIPGQFLDDIKRNKPGRGTFVENGKIYAEVLGVLNKNAGYINVVPLKGRYDPVENDLVIGVVLEAMSSSWLVDINAAYPAFLHVNEVPWDIEFGETEKYLNHGDTIMAKVLQVDMEKRVQLTLNDRNLYKIKGGHLIEVEPSRVPRVIGKKGSMISLLKKYTRCRIFVGQNGRIWVDGNDEGVEKVIYVIKMIEREALSYGLTNRVEVLLKKDAKDVR
ncbi:MAG: RNA-binding protein [Thermoplasmata archaeon]|nr:MAG: S1 RNA-binding domain-containing protein [Thermoplasmata archaeon]RLF31362.1 MAG: RNA-binding protein [Thermoplasmata archaeon]RLF36016.1 MAG: RNA-binding protein [Thermoplasmata archaeon]RLF53462.1 MAG: RNA-binding protein [Thermoplasmata archaeon]